MKNLILISFLICNTLVSKAQVQGQRCGDTTPQFCIDEPVLVDGIGPYKITGIVKGGYITENDSSVRFYNINKAKGCGYLHANLPKLCVGHSIIVEGIPGYKVTGIGKSGTTFFTTADSAERSATLALTRGCGLDSLHLCVNNEVSVDGKSGYVVIGISADGLSYITNFDRSARKSTLKKLRSSNPASVDSLTVFLSTDTQDIVQTYKELASVVTQERAEFLKSSSAYLAQMNSEDVNIFAGMVLSKIVRLSTSAAVKDNFEKPIGAFQKDLETKNWKSIDQIEANLRTVDFANRVIAAALKLKMKMAQVSSQDQSTMVQLGKIATINDLIAKKAALQEFCKANKYLIEELVQDPRHGAIGMVTADVMQWVMNK